jgi:integrase
VVQIVKATPEKHLYSRGKLGTKYVRRRIPAALRWAYPPHQTHLLRSLGTSDLRLAKSLAVFELAKIEAEFEAKKAHADVRRASLCTQRVRRLSDAELKAIGRSWAHQVLSQDEVRRHEGLDDEEFEALGEQLESQHRELRRMLAQGRTSTVLPALRSFLHLCGLDFDPDTEEAKRATRCFTETLVETLGHQLRRHAGERVETTQVAPATAHPLHVIVPELAPKSRNAANWENAFAAWRDFVVNRPKSMVIAYQTPWRDLRCYAAESGIHAPSDVTPQVMAGFVARMQERGLAVDTINERLTKVRSIYKVACGRFVLSHNPAATTLGCRESSVRSRQKRRLAFDARDVQRLFGSAIYTQHLRSRGQAGEASYWIPLLMFYTGARPEEIAGLALGDLREHPTHGWFFDIVDRPSAEDAELFTGEASTKGADETLSKEDLEQALADRAFFSTVPDSHRRTLKNKPSIRRVPVAQELIDLGLLRYVEFVRGHGHTVFFPTLTQDWHGKLSGAFGKFFTRYKRDIGIEDPRKVLYSLRHTMKDLLEEAGVPSKYLKRLLGHATGDGAITDGYGSELPWRRIVEQFRLVRFPSIPAAPWQPGRGAYRFTKAAATGV